MNDRYPDFIGIGAQKAATTWLYAVLSSVPGIWLPPEKELHYWSDGDWARNPSLVDRLFGEHHADRRWRQKFTRTAKRSLRNPDIERLRWSLRFFLCRRNDDWYRRLFPGKSSKWVARGEITPKYAILRDSEIRRITSINPEIKFIYLLRDPIDRTWSQTRMDFGRMGKNLEAADRDEIRKYLERADVLERGMYFKTLSKYQKHVSSNAIFLATYDDVCQKPEVVVAELLTFLGVHYPDGSECDALLHKRVFQGEEKEIPVEIAQHLARTYLADLRALAADGRVDCSAWLERAERMAASPA